MKHISKNATTDLMANLPIISIMILKMGRDKARFTLPSPPQCSADFSTLRTSDKRRYRRALCTLHPETHVYSRRWHSELRVLRFAAIGIGFYVLVYMWPAIPVNARDGPRRGSWYPFRCCFIRFNHINFLPR